MMQRLRSRFLIALPRLPASRPDPLTVPSYAGPSASRSGDVAGTLRLLAYLALALVLIVLDHRGGWLSRGAAAGAGR